MINTIVYFLLCITHFVLATKGLLPIWLLLLLTIVLVAYTYSFVKFDKSVWIQPLFFLIYLFTDSIIANLVVLLCSALVWVYSITMQRKLTIAQASKNKEDQMQQFNETFQTVRKERHDYLKHIAAIHYLLDSEQLDDAKQYMTKLLDRYEETNLSIKGEEGAIASVLHTNYKRARAENIAINYQLDVPVSQIPISSVLLVELIGNILENAVDACIQWQREKDEQGFIEFHLRKTSGLFLLSCQNSTLPLPSDVADQLFMTSSISTKAQHEGMGTIIIQDIINRHHGFLDFTAEKNTFSITCKIPNFQQSVS